MCDKDGIIYHLPRQGVVKADEVQFLDTPVVTLIIPVSSTKSIGFVPETKANSGFSIF
jgi:hypothetical protein